MDESSKQKYVPSKSEMRKVVLASLLGATIEWYDFFLYGVVAGIVFNKLYFPTADPFLGTIMAYSTFAIGYLARPLGGFIFGHYGDKLGRKRMLILTMLIMGIATVEQADQTRMLILMDIEKLVTSADMGLSSLTPANA